MSFLWSDKRYRILRTNLCHAFLPSSYHADLTAASAAQLDTIRSMLGHNNNEPLLMSLYAASCAEPDVKSALVTFYQHLSPADEHFLMAKQIDVATERWLLSEA